MAEKKAKRGRPKGSGIDDSEMLAKIAAIMAADPEVKPTTAIKKAGITNPSTIRRLRDKFSQDERKLMKAAGGKPQRRKAAPAAAKKAAKPAAAPKVAAKAPAAKAAKAAPARKAAAKAPAPAAPAARKPAAKAAPARKAAAPAAKKPAAKATKAAAKAPARAAAKAPAKKPTAGRAPAKRTVAKAAGKGSAKKSSSDHLPSRPLKSMPASSRLAASGKVSAAAGDPAGAAGEKTAGAAQLLRFISEPEQLLKQFGRLPKDVDAAVGSMVENQIQVYESAIKNSPLAAFLRQQAFMIDMSLSILKAQQQWARRRPRPSGS
ncbi:MAG: hypothetical protein GC150_13955 [Rhizobiales bacterium]|nr:hypothetical protein [Hyphomicrobiales bacterium]